MLERVPAAAESTAHFFLRSAEKPLRSSRVLDPRFWRNGADGIESSAWWSSYLQRVRTVPQVVSPNCEEFVVVPAPSATRLAQASFLRCSRESLPHPSINSRAQQNGNALRSYSVSAAASQSTRPQLADESVDGTEQGGANASTKSPSITKEQGRSRGEVHTDEARSKKHLSKHTRQKPHFEASAVASTNEEAKVVRDQLRAFDLTTDAVSDRLDGDSFAHQMRRSDRELDRPNITISVSPVRPAQHKDVEIDVPCVTTTSGVQKKKNRVLRPKPSPRDKYESFDPNSPHEGLAQNPAGPFDLTQSSGLGSPMINSKPDLLGGWQHSNSFASLVPGEEVDDGLSKESWTILSQGLAKQKETPLDLLEELAGSTVTKPPIKLAEVPKEQSEIPLDTFKPNAESNDELSKKMTASLEAVWVPLPGPDAAPQNQNQPYQPATPPTESVEVQPSDYKKARFDALMRIKVGTTASQFDEAWSLFLSFDDQERLAPYMFRFLTRSQNSKHYSRALAAFNLVPRPRRSRPMYQAAMHIELRRHQHGSAMNLAFEANIRGFNVLPELFAYLVKNLLWRSVAELLHRNINAREEFAQFALVPEISAVARRRMLPISELLEECNDISDLHTKVLSLAEKVQAPDFALMEHHGLLKNLCHQLIIRTVQIPAVLAMITPQALLAILDLGEHFDNVSLHVKALDTIFQLPQRGDKLNLALTVYRNLRFRRLNQPSNPRIIKELISICGETEQTSTLLYDYLLDQLRPYPDVEAYHKIVVQCARKGNARAVHKYLELCMRHHGMPQRVAFVNPVIYAYAVDGNITEARQQFVALETKYRLSPDIVSWNMLMLAHIRSDDDISAFDVLEEMRKKKVKFNEYTYGQLLAVCAAHGDTEAALDVLVDARDDHVQVSIPMINTVVETYLKNDNPQAALRFAVAASDSENKENLTRLWNSFIRYFAFKGQTGYLLKIRNMMARYNVASDGMTYAPLMTLLTSKRRTSEALKLLRQMHDQEKLPVTMLHYSIILNGFVAEDNRDAAYLIFDEMKQRFPSISASANAAMLSLQARRDGRIDLQGPEKGSHGLKMLAELVKDISSAEGAPFNAVSGRSQQDRVAVSMYFETIIRALIRSGSHDSAAQLMKHVQDSLVVNTQDKSGIPTSSRGMVLARLDIAMERHDWVEFDRIWNIAFQNALKVNSSIPTIREGQITERTKTEVDSLAPSHAKYGLSSYLNRYMEAMARQFRQNHMRQFFETKLFPSGFAFTGKNWNKYIQVLCRSFSFRDQVRAFKIFEKTMRSKTQSWDLLTRGKIRKRTTKYLWQPYGQRNRPILQRQNVHRIVKRVDELRLHPGQKVPTYLTAVHLGSVLIRAYQRAQQGHSEQLHQIRARAPRTKRFIQFMPRLKDGIQGSILRRLDDRENRKPRPRSEESFSEKTDLSGVMGDSSPLSHMPFEYLKDVEEITGRSNVVRSLLKDEPKGRSRRRQEHQDVELGEMFTGQISRTPIMLAGQGRMETAAELQRRISKEEQQKRDKIQRLREDLTARSLAKDIYRPPVVRAEPPPDFKDIQEVDVEPQQANPAMTDLLSFLGRPGSVHRSEAGTDLASVSADKSTGPLGPVSISRQLDNLAEMRRQGNKDLETRKERGEPIAPLAITFMHSRRLRRRLALGQRKQARQLLEGLRGRLSSRAYAIRTRAAKRLEAFERAQRRRGAVLAYERDVKAGKRLDPFPRTMLGIQRRRAMHGPVRVRFVPDLGRKTKNYLVRRGVLYDKRQKRIQTVKSKGKNYVTRWDRMQQWLDSHYPRTE